MKRGAEHLETHIAGDIKKPHLGEKTVYYDGTSGEDIIEFEHEFGSKVKDLFAMEKGSTFLNHGSVGACPKEVLAKQAALLTQIESHPGKYYRHDRKVLLNQSKEQLSRFIGADDDDVVFVSNATTGVNAVLRSLDIQQGDEIICLKLAYPAVRNTLRYVCYYTQNITTLRELKVECPIHDVDRFIECIGNSITRNTRLMVFDAITSPTGIVLPLEKLIKKCHEKEVPVLIDGAHGAGQLPLNLISLGADYYVGTCHKWLFAPKGSAFLYIEKSKQHLIKPTVTSDGHDKGFQLEFESQGTRDESPFICIQYALDFYRKIGIEKVRKYNTSLVRWAAKMLTLKWGTETLVDLNMTAFMVSIRLPINLNTLCVKKGGDEKDVDAEIEYEAIMNCVTCRHLTELLYERYNIDIASIFIFGEGIKKHMYVRISAQIYNERNDYIRFGDAMLEILKSERFL